MFLNSFDIDEAQMRVSQEQSARPNLETAVAVLVRLRDWTDANSDGWPYWSKPSNASQKLQTAVSARFFGAWDSRVNDDLTGAELKSAISPVKAFLTRQNVEHSLVL